MAIFKCKMCGGTIEFEPGATVGVCDSCGMRQTLPRLDDERKANLYARADHFRRVNDYDKAMSIYEQVLNEDSSDAETYWSLVLCRYGIEYVEDPASHQRVPTVNRAQYTSIFSDEDFKSALQYADGVQREVYMEEARAIDEIQKGILAISQKEDPFDIFICYKETDAGGRRTPDSVLANDLYHQLTDHGYKVFFSRITLEDKLGTAYEPYIFAALNSAKVMVVIGTKPEYFNAVWVKNEWSRYLALIRNGEEKILIPAYRDMDPYDLPDEFSHLQAQDMSKLGFMQDLIRGIQKMIGPESGKAVSNEKMVLNSGTPNIEPLLKRVFLFLEDESWDEADAYCEKVLDQDPENARAYLGKLMVELQVRKPESLKNSTIPLTKTKNYRKVLRFADPELSKTLKEYNAVIKDRNEKNRLNGIYRKAVSLMKEADTEAEYYEAVGEFEKIPGYEDADLLAVSCREKAEICRKDREYFKAKVLMANGTEKGYLSAAEILGRLPGWKDADILLGGCKQKLWEIRAWEENQKRKAEEERIKAVKREKMSMRIQWICVGTLAFVLLLFLRIIPASKYSKAAELFSNGNYQESYQIFKSISYKDSRKKANASLFNLGLQYIDEERYQDALDIFSGLSDEDSKQKAEECSMLLTYETAMRFFEEENYQEAYDLFSSINCKGSEEKAAECIYTMAMQNFKEENYQKAYDLFNSISYKDSEKKAAECIYTMAMKDYDEGNYREAYNKFGQCSFKDSKQMAEECMLQFLNKETVKVGETVEFGFYEQDNDLTNGAEVIEWDILDVEEDYALLISKKVLDSRRFNDDHSGITWETCDLREWLNGTFLETAFGSPEMRFIVERTVPGDDNWLFHTKGGNATEDKVFLLSVTEAEAYFSSDIARRANPTEYAKAHDAQTSNENGRGWWRLRTPGFDLHETVYVDYDGSIQLNGNFIYSDRVGLRPALQIELR